MMFENLFSLGSLFAITVSLTLTVKSLRINSIKNIKINSPDVVGNNNQVIINPAITKKVADFKQLSNIIIILLLIAFPFFPGFFMNFILTFSFCAVMICIFGVFKNIRQKGDNAAYGLVYIPLTAFIGVFSISAIYSAFSGEYMFTDFYSRIINKVGLLNTSPEYLNSLIVLVLEGTAYAGMSILFASLIHVCFGFLKNRNFDETVNFIKYWIPLSVVGHFLASGYFIAFYYGNFQYVINSYRNIFSNFFSYLF
ncbi:hypothetical protein [Pectobacterium parmentieri]|uniref:hypothetical protein n=1 Tax=Pectobacterium parmentieri TaxID=1905730 RepID=UPI0018E153C5|nr:hypothetical protein [Pectobacterium parmentieri]QQA74549.1 hypothetical protein JBL47_14185 [Pectobacterium parmentieri]